MKKYIVLLLSLAVVIMAASGASAVSLGTLRLSGSFEDGYVGDRYGLLSKHGNVEFNYSMAHIIVHIAVTRGTLPTGLRLKQWGDDLYLDGEATEAGTFEFDITVSGESTSGYGYTFNSSTTTFIVTILPNPNIKDPTISGTFPDGTVGVLYSNSVYASDGVSPYVWGWVDSSLPPGLGMKYSGGTLTLSGQPKEAGDYSFYVSLLDNYGHDCTKEFTVKITESGTSGGNGSNGNSSNNGTGSNNNTNTNNEGSGTGTGNNNGSTGTEGGNTGGTSSSGGSSGGGGCNAGLGFIALAIAGTALIRKH